MRNAFSESHLKELEGGEALTQQGFPSNCRSSGRSAPVQLPSKSLPLTITPTAPTLSSQTAFGPALDGNALNSAEGRGLLCQQRSGTSWCQHSAPVPRLPAQGPANVRFIFGVQDILHALEAVIAYTPIRI